MKKIVYLFILSLIIPFTVSAMDNSSIFDIGDNVTVSFDGGTTKIGFYVIKNSSADETSVTLFYDGIIATHDSNGNIKEGQVVYQLPDRSSTNPSQFEGSYVQKVLNEAVAEAKWIINGSPRLLEENDLVNLGITRDNDRTYTILKKYDFLKPLNFESAPSITTTDYWTQISDGTDKVYAVTKDGADSNAGISAKIKSYSVDPVTTTANYSIRPVVVVNKEYILCNNTKGNTPSDKVDNVDTGVEDYVLLLVGVGSIATILYVNVKKKNKFQEI